MDLTREQVETLIEGSDWPWRLPDLLPELYFVQTEETGSSKWGNWHEVVFRHAETGRWYSFSYDCTRNEGIDWCCLMDGDVCHTTEVEPIEVTRIEYWPVKKAIPAKKP